MLAHSVGRVPSNSYGYEYRPANPPRLFPQLNQDYADLQGHNRAMSPPEINIQLAPPSRQASFEPMSPPEINIQLAPPSRQASFEPAVRSEGALNGALSRPEHSRSSNRTRPKGDKRLNREYILDLVDQSRPASTQRIPATYQCSLCPQRFTRAYNMRSHLRAHRDERPFLCNHCGSAFARQADRKSHEGLHSGEKKFVCRGDLKNGHTWGCGRRFARSSNLGRHLRRESGRVCIKPLLEQEAVEKDAATTLANIARTDHGLSSGSPQFSDFTDWPLINNLNNDHSRLQQQPRSRSNLSTQERLQVLETILRLKGFNVEEEVNSQLRSRGLRRGDI